MDFWRSIAGMLEVEMSSADIGDSFYAVNRLNIPIFHAVYVSDLTIRFQIRRKDLKCVCDLCKKRGESLRVLEHKGLFWPMQGLLKRPVILFGLLFFLGVALYVPTRVYFVRVDGNFAVPTKRILEAAEDCGICFGASRREVRSEKVKNALLSSVPELQWAGVNTKGCVATISVNERNDTLQEESVSQVSSIVASRDGIISSCTATRGNLMVRIGQAVKEGQLLISGYTNCGFTIQATRAEGDVFAQTKREQTVWMPSQYIHQENTAGQKKKYSLLLGKKRINLWNNSGIWDATYDRMYEEYYITLPGGFRLPVALCVEEYIVYQTVPCEIPQSLAEETLSAYAAAYLTEKMIAGNFLNRIESFSLADGCYRLDGQYVCMEMIGRVRQEQIGEENEENG